MAFYALPRPMRERGIAQHTRIIGEILSQGFVNVMDRNYSYEGSARTGPPSRPPEPGRPRSRPGEFPQEQMGILRSAIFFEEIDSDPNQVQYKVGLNVTESRDPAKLRAYLIHIEGVRGQVEFAESRFGLTMTAESVNTHREMMQHLAANLPPDRFRVE
jgi:hypothetical protein